MNANTTREKHDVAEPLDLTKLDPNNERTAFMNIIRDVDTAVCNMDVSLPVLEKIILERVHNTVIITYSWDNTSEYQVDFDTFQSKVRKQNPAIISVRMGKSGLTLIIVNIHVGNGISSSRGPITVSDGVASGDDNDDQQYGISSRIGSKRAGGTLGLSFERASKRAKTTHDDKRRDDIEANQ